MPLAFEAGSARKNRADLVRDGVQAGPMASDDSSTYCCSTESDGCNTPQEETLDCEGGSGASLSGSWMVKNTFLDFVEARALVEEQESRRRAATAPSELGAQAAFLALLEAEREADAGSEDETTELPPVLALHPGNGTLATESPAPAQWAEGSWPGCCVPVGYTSVPYYGGSVPVTFTGFSSAPLSAPCSSVPRMVPGDWSMPVGMGADGMTWEQTVTRSTVAAPGTSSVGSEFHNKGRCKPCAFVWKPQGCGNGEACLFCHMCGPDEIQKRKRAKKERFAVARQRKAAKAAELALVAAAAEKTAQAIATEGEA